MSTSSQGLISLGHNNLKSNHDAMSVFIETKRTNLVKTFITINSCINR